MFIEDNCADVFGDFGLLKCKPVRIRLRPNAQPYNLAPPCRISAPLLGPLKEELKRIETNHIVTSVTTPIGWCSLIEIVLKPNGKIRICVDYKRLNYSVMREQFTMPTVDEITAKMTGSKVFSALDCSLAF